MIQKISNNMINNMKIKFDFKSQNQKTINTSQKDLKYYPSDYIDDYWFNKIDYMA